MDEARIRAIVQRVVAELGERIVVERGSEERRAGESLYAPRATPLTSDGLFPNVDAAIQAATIAQRQLIVLTLEKRGEIIAAMRQAAREAAEAISRLAHEETGMGRWQDKLQKNLLVANKTPGIEDLEPIAWTGDRGLTLTERAPYGVIGAITPSTNPTATIICNAIGMIAAGNSVVFNAHPAAKRCSAAIVQVLHRAIVAAGGPPNVITTTPEPTIESAQEIMRHLGVRLLVVTGGPGVVKVAMNSGKKAICAGPGNPPVVVDETANLDQAARDIVFGASFDNNVICTEEKEIVAVDSIADKLKAAMLRHQAIELSPWQLKQLERVLFAETPRPGCAGTINKQWVGRHVSTILRQIGVTVEDSVRLAFVEVPKEHPLFWTEQLLPIMPLVRVKTADEAIDLAIAVEQGNYHTAVMHSQHLEHLSRMAKECNCSIFVKNGPSLAGLGYGGEGYTSFTIASPTGEGVTGPHSFTRLRRCTLVDAFRIV